MCSSPNQPIHCKHLLLRTYTSFPFYMPVVIKFNCILTNSKMVFEFSHFTVYSTRRAMWIDAYSIHRNTIYIVSFWSVQFLCGYWKCRVVLFALVRVYIVCRLIVALEREQADQPCRQCHKICSVQIFYFEANTLNAERIVLFSTIVTRMQTRACNHFSRMGRDSFPGPVSDRIEFSAIFICKFVSIAVFGCGKFKLRYFSIKRRR